MLNFFCFYLAPVRGWGSWKCPKVWLVKLEWFMCLIFFYLAPVRGWGSWIMSECIFSNIKKMPVLDFFLMEVFALYLAPARGWGTLNCYYLLCTYIVRVYLYLNKFVVCAYKTSNFGTLNVLFTTWKFEKKINNLFRHLSVWWVTVRIFVKHCFY